VRGWWYVWLFGVGSIASWHAHSGFVNSERKRSCYLLQIYFLVAQLMIK
jgi:hypothetical protein